MKCPYCGAELKYEDYYYSGRPESFYGTASNGIHYPSTMKKLGEIYKCPNSSGFQNLEEAEIYKENNPHLEQYKVEDIACDSEIFNGFFYTDSREELHEGYPC